MIGAGACYRIRKHDIEEFGEVVQRHGTYKRDLEAFARILLAKKQTPSLFNREETTVPAAVTEIQPRDGKAAAAQN